LGDEGGQSIVKNMIKNKTLHTLNLASNEITETTAAVLSEVNEAHLYVVMNLMVVMN